MANLTHVYGWTPFVMVSSLVCGVIFAIGHHFFYHFLVNKPTSTGDYKILGTTYPGQQLNTAIGTGFTFLVKALFSIALSISYYQIFWGVARQDIQTKKPLTLKQLDTAFAGPSDVTTLLQFPIWIRYWLLFSLAVIVWLSPIAFIVPPATLSVDLRENIQTVTTQQVPQIDFPNLAFLATMPNAVVTDSNLTQFNFNGPSQVTKQIAAGVAARNAIMPITAPFLNSSWGLNFSGPSLRCGPVSPSDSLHFERNIAEFLSQEGNCDVPATYLAWFPGINLEDYTIFSPPYSSSPSNTSAPTFFDPEALFRLGYINGLSVNLTFYLATIPGVLQLQVAPGDAMGGTSLESSACSLQNSNQNLSTSNNPLGPLTENMSMLQCQLYNSTYLTEFNYTNGIQSVSVNVTAQDKDTAVRLLPSVDATLPDDLGPDNCTALVSEETQNPSQCEFNISLLSQLSYQAVLQAFASIITGNITLAGFTLGLMDATSIRSTSLMATKELYYLTDSALNMDTQQNQLNLQNIIMNSNSSEVSGAKRLQQAPSSQSLSDVIEIMFQNFTVSLMSSPQLQPNYSSAGAPPNATVTQSTTQQVYAYAAGKLWAAYGTATLFTLASVIVGILAMFRNGASYDDAFSTILRAARGAELSVEMEHSDMEGRSPLPTYLANATVVLPVGKSEESASDAKEEPVAPNDASAETALLSEPSSERPHEDNDTNV
ncbi:MAG: hypothetical protein M1822_000408 [Bathelium mastoideum]|nr:MAG: hypothetical protein M1822_000408 [Bathelium mastoideum]